jgi:hypothetical protein
MPVWANTGNPPGPLNYKQIDYLIAFLRAKNTEEFRVMDPGLFEPVLDKAGNEITFKGWVDPTYQPVAGATPFPDCWADEFSTPASAAPSAGASAGPTGSEAPSGTVVKEVAKGIAFVNQDLAAPADAPFGLELDNQDGGTPHNIEIKGPTGAPVFKGEIFNGPAVKTYEVPALGAGDYTFICSVHPNMTGTLKVGG